MSAPARVSEAIISLAAAKPQFQLYSRRALAFYHETPKSILEKAEENDMMRFVENGHKVHAIVSPYKTVSVDTP